MSLEGLNEQVKRDLTYLNFGGPEWVQPLHHPEGHVYDVVIVGGGQSGLSAAFALKRERIYNVLIIDENPEGYEGPWETYARMVTLRTPKELTSIDLGIPSLTFRSWWVSQAGEEGWEKLDKIPRGEWMNYLRWYRNVLKLPVVNEVKLKLIEPSVEGIHHLHIEGTGAPSEKILARKVILATGIQGGGEWHVPPLISKKLTRERYAHTSESIDFELLKGKKVAILGGGASAFDNAHAALSEGVAEVHVFVRRKELPRINPIRQMEGSGIIEHFHTFSDEEKYTAISQFFKFNQPPTNDTFIRASAWPGFQLHLGAPWHDVEATSNCVVVTTPQGKHTFDFLIISTGFVTDPSLRPELKLIDKHIARWGDKYTAPEEIANPLVDAHPYLSSGFSFTSRDEQGKNSLYGLFVFNYSTLVSCGLSASALSGIRFALPKLALSVSDQLFQDDKARILHNFLTYDKEEFVGEWPKIEQQVTSATEN
ncbi:NAD(P)-binding domain-containing protein [Robertmurraya kyonggiensis]|uniref:NAD(P)/FAD-dependent oxidoreductase n=1 Tax=Robertmurraya kyonggiensis TaxID=1037680 RepID=A0A4U1D1M7_9BACI|nr:NAD(P)/FAD-dependent oxidoreductase [Robertmurraya kyonggiensis]TKC16111.1 NAD(P)/FAD-dependent oxidoreductase [Robertmurraya kyonggiensis]